MDGGRKTDATSSHRTRAITVFADNRRQNPRWRRIALSSLACAAVVAGSVATVTTQTIPLVHLRVRTARFMNFGLLKMAQEDGVFARQGLDVELVDLDSNATIPSLIRGDIDVTPISLSPAALNAVVRGARVRVVASNVEYAAGRCPSSALVVSRSVAASSRLMRADGIRGLKLGGGRAILTQFIIDRWLQPFSLSFADLIQMDVPEAIQAEALRSGRLDIAVLGEPALTQALAGGDIVVWKALNEIAPGFQDAVLLYGSRLLDKEPDVGQRFMNAYIEATRRFAEGKTPHNVEGMSRATGLEPDLVRRVCWPQNLVDPVINTARLLEFQSWAVAHGLIDRAVRADELIDSRFTDAARRRSTGR